jgi:hypothetical protein
MDDVKRATREAEETANEAWRNRDGEDLADKVGNLGDDIRKGLDNAGDEIRRGSDTVADELGDRVDDTADVPRRY